MNERALCDDCPYLTKPRPRLSATALTEIAMAVAAAHYVRVSDILSHSRLRPYAEARLHFYYEAVMGTTNSLPQIGRWCGGRDHTTVLQGARRYARKHNLPIPSRRGEADDRSLS